MERGKNNAVRRFSIIMLSLVVAFTFIPWTSDGFSAHAAPKKVKMTVYDQVIKSGRTIYCAGITGVYKVKLSKKGNLKSKKRIFRTPEMCGATAMKKKGKHIYFIMTSSSWFSHLYRITTSGKKKIDYTEGPLGDPVTDYAIKGKKLYYVAEDEWNDGGPLKKYVLKLNGKKRQSTKVRAQMKRKKTNAKGYYVIEKHKGDYYYNYLKTPKRTYYLGRQKS